MEIQKINIVTGTGISLQGDEIDTDRIIPARFLKNISFSGIEKNIFCDERQQLEGEGKLHPFDQKHFQEANILITNKNFGCGSSREHAPQALHRWGIKVILAEGFSEIFLANCIAIGMPCIILMQEEIKQIQEIVEEEPSIHLSISLAEKKLKVAEQVFQFQFDESIQKFFLEGTWDSTTTLLENKKNIYKIVKKIPYMEW